MRTSLWLLTSLFTVTLAACTEDKSETESGTATAATDTTGAATTGTGTTAAETTTGETTAAETTGTPTTDPTTTDAPTTDATTTDATTTDGTTGGADLSCESYCGIYATACDDVSEYDNDAACMAQCSQWPVGELNATAGDSLGCRLYHVTVASTTDPLVHCPHAGPSGAAVCVDGAAPTCADYCAKYFENCKDDLNLYNDEADCATQCAGWYPGVKDDVGGDSVGCRLYHAGAALADAPLHCPHAGPGGADVCVTP
jgi:hypothetical protein